MTNATQDHMDLVPQRQNSFSDTVNKIFAGFCDPNKGDDDDEEHDENGTPGEKSVSFSNKVTVSDGNSTPQARSLQDTREARSLVSNGNDPSTTSNGKRSIFPELVSTAEEKRQETKDSTPVKEESKQPEQRNLEPVETDIGENEQEEKAEILLEDEQKPRGILKPPSKKKTKPLWRERLSSPRAQRTMEVVFLTLLALGLTAGFIYYGLGDRLEFVFEHKQNQSIIQFGKNKQPQEAQHVSSSFAHEDQVNMESYEAYVEPSGEEAEMDKESEETEELEMEEEVTNSAREETPVKDNGGEL